MKSLIVPLVCLAVALGMLFFTLDYLSHQPPTHKLVEAAAGCEQSLQANHEFVSMTRELVDLHNPAVNQTISRHLDKISKILAEDK